MILAVAGSAILGHQLGVSTGKPSTVTTKRLVVADPYAGGGTWFKGNLHVASVRGVGKDLPSAIGAWYAAHGYAFLGISDMNTYTWTSEYGTRAHPGVPTVDATYPFADVLAVGMDHWQPASNLQGAIDWIAHDGGLPVLAAARSQSLATVMAVRGLFGLEVYDASVAYSNPGQGDATAMWDRLLSAGNRVYAFAGDDATGLHDPALGRAWIDVLATAQDLGSLLSSLRQGAFIASTGAEFTRLNVGERTVTAEAKPRSSLRFIGRGGQLLKAVSASSASYQVSGDEGYVRVEAIGGDGARAWSQPFYVSWR
ncbi:MAG TPA: hypothetical protein VN973_00270 [Candidatus Dormibacteraeota bacterium]|nr:hypothetical protein [Candidatus Dormibacteraeota bacterium]